MEKTFGKATFPLQGRLPTHHLCVYRLPEVFSVWKGVPTIAILRIRTNSETSGACTCEERGKKNL